MTSNEKERLEEELEVRKQLHKNYDILLALYLSESRKLPSQANLLELAKYSHNKINEIERMLEEDV